MGVIKMTKAMLRKKMLVQLQQLTTDEKIAIEKKLLNELIHSSIWEQAKTIGITISLPFEWNTTSIIEAAWKNNKSVCVPRCIVQTKQMEFFRITSFEQLIKGYANILEPDYEKLELVKKSQIDLMLVPGIVFDKEGYRIGFGGGYFDRYLASFNQATASLVSEQQLIDYIPKDGYDIPVHYLIMEDGVFNVK